MNGATVLDLGTLAAAVCLAVSVLCGYRLALLQSAVAAVSRSRLRTLGEQGNRRAELLAGMLAHRDVMQTSLRYCADLALAAAAVAAWWLAARWAPEWGVERWVVGLGVLALLLLCHDLLPRLLAALDPEQALLRHTRMVAVIYRLLGGTLRDVLEPAPAPGRDEPDDDSAEESIRELVEAMPLEENRRRRISDILEFPDQTVGDVMVPRVDLVGVAADLPLSQVAAALIESGYSRLPVFGATKDDVVGVVHAKDVLRGMSSGLAARDIARDPLFVAPTMRLDQLLRELRVARSSLALVVDEYGGTAGMVTVEDVVEEIVGEIADETDTVVAPALRPRPSGGWLVPARLELDELADALALELEHDSDANTVGGLVLAKAGALPEPGQVLAHASGGLLLLLRVLALEGTRLTELELVLLPQEETVRPKEDPTEPENNEPVTQVVVDGATRLATVEQRLGYDAQAPATLCAGDLFCFWPAGERGGREVRWRSQRARVVAEEPDGDLRVAFEPAGQVGER